MESQKNQTLKCQICKKKTSLVCNRCTKPTCKSHVGVISRSLYCPDCMFVMKKQGLIKSWGVIGIMLILGAILLITF